MICGVSQLGVRAIHAFSVALYVHILHTKHFTAISSIDTEFS